MSAAFSQLASSPALYPFALDLERRALFLLHLEEADYLTSSFLDERIAAKTREGSWLSLSAAEQMLRTPVARKPLHFIFHSGHVGSTLLSRLIDETGAVLPLREPKPLRALAEANDAGIDGLGGALEILTRLWERGYPRTRAVILKATSSAQRLAPRLLAARPQAKAVALNVSAHSYLAGALAAPNSAVDLNAHGPERLYRLNLMGIVAPRPKTLGELAAMSWLAERLTQAQAQEAFGARILPVDFDSMLGALEETLARVLSHFGLPDPSRAAAELAGSDVLARYSKAPQHPYSPALRAERLADAERRYPDEIRAALDWLAALAGRHSTLAGLL
jgi:hypothetical protein